MEVIVLPGEATPRLTDDLDETVEAASETYGNLQKYPPSLSYRSLETESEDDKIRRLFDETDLDSSGTLNMKEIKSLCQKLGDIMSRKALEEAFERMGGLRRQGGQGSF